LSVFPPEEYGKFKGNPHADGFIGCWKKKDAKKIAKQLRKDGFNVVMRGRGPRKKRRKTKRSVCVWSRRNDQGVGVWTEKWFGNPKEYRKGCSSDSCSIKAATHLSIYIRDAEIREVNPNDVEWELLCQQRGIPYKPPEDLDPRTKAFIDSFKK
jgi:hypothetical protein